MVRVLIQFVPFYLFFLVIRQFGLKIILLDKDRGVRIVLKAFYTRFHKKLAILIVFIHKGDF